MNTNPCSTYIGEQRCKKGKGLAAAVHTPLRTRFIHVGSSYTYIASLSLGTMCAGAACEDRTEKVEEMRRMSCAAYVTAL